LIADGQLRLSQRLHDKNGRKADENWENREFYKRFQDNINRGVFRHHTRREKEGALLTTSQ
jgi:hypothetical protein